MCPGIKEICDFARLGKRIPSLRLAGARDDIGSLQEVDRLLGADGVLNDTVFTP
jgi:hypothetical protein